MRGLTCGRATFQAFDEAWEIIAPHTSDNFLAAHAARLRLAKAIHKLAREKRWNAKSLKEAALQSVDFDRT